MVARTPPKQAKMVAPLNPALLAETVKKVDRCMARLQELQFTVARGRKVVSGVSLSPRSTRTYLRTSLRCKQESVRIKDAVPRKSPVGKFPARSRDSGEWKRMSLSAMLVGETVVEILQASQFARDIVEVIANKNKKLLNQEDPKTPLSQQRRRAHAEDTNLRARRQKEKQINIQSRQSECESPMLRRARSRINFKVSPPKRRDFVDKENNRHLANRVSPKNKPWAKKTVLFPNPLFLSTPSQQPKFCKTRSPIIARNRQTPHKFLIKSPPSGSKFQVKMKKKSSMASISTPKKSPKMSAASKLRRSFSPSRLAARLVSPLKSRKESRKKEEGTTTIMRGHRYGSLPLGISALRI